MHLDVPNQISTKKPAKTGHEVLALKLIQHKKLKPFQNLNLIISSMLVLYIQQ